ncbi:hypothetical protein N7495_001948 [Penicillium taxi]|uniref:uncharacterized protein n=1 Tax=Penicillium taxi TaxID=168475 RepID=UPI00254512D1|nr:uncharacterized protein N7495_001948 [Penicillium taxi]KAJ5909266.1 hypothetical protein N7495_001948 [Penicillium taxi]
MNSEWGQDTLLSPSALERQVSSCSTSGYSMTYTSTSTVSSTSSASTTVVASHCNTTDPDQTVYKVESGDTCVAISAAQNVSTPVLINLNSLDMGCTHIVVGSEICLPDVCEVYRVQNTDTIDSIFARLSRQVSVPQFVAWNTNLNSVQISKNLISIAGKYICVSPPGTLTLPDTLALRPASTAVSSKDCGHCISMNDFDFLNLQAALNTTSTCGNLWKGNSYCVQAVGNINTYTGYTSNSSQIRTTLASTINPNFTRTANHSTTHLSWSFPADLTTTSTWTPDSALLASLASYTLCDQVNTVYNITDGELSNEMSNDEQWLSLYDRVCGLLLNGTWPTRGFNFSITLTDDSSVGSSTMFISHTASPHASSQIITATASSTSSAASSTSTISPNGLLARLIRIGLVWGLSLVIVVVTMAIVGARRSIVLAPTAILSMARSQGGSAEAWMMG